MKQIVNKSNNPAFSLAVEEYLLNKKTSGDYLMLWISSPSVIIGKFQNPFLEISPGLCEEDGVNIVRRNSGGGTVYHDKGNLNYTIVTDRGEESPEYNRFLNPIIEFLSTIGLKAEISDTSAIVSEGRKISGNAESVVGNRIMHHGTLLFDSSLSSLNRYTGKARSTITSKSIKSNPSPVGNIREMLSLDMTIGEFSDKLASFLADDIYEFDSGELEEINGLMNDKYMSWEWNFGKSSAFTIDDNGFMLSSKHGIIESVSDYSDILVGEKLEYSHIKELLRSSLEEKEAEKISHIIFG